MNEGIILITIPVCFREIFSCSIIQVLFSFFNKENRMYVCWCNTSIFLADLSVGENSLLGYKNLLQPLLLFIL